MKFFFIGKFPWEINLRFGCYFSFFSFEYTREFLPFFFYDWLIDIKFQIRIFFTFRKFHSIPCYYKFIYIRKKGKGGTLKKLWKIYEFILPLKETFLCNKKKKIIKKRINYDLLYIYLSIYIFKVLLKTKLALITRLCIISPLIVPASHKCALFDRYDYWFRIYAKLWQLCTI